MTGNPLALATPEQTANRKKERLFVYGKGARNGRGIICVTDSRGQPKHQWRSEVAEAVRKASGDLRTEIVVDASEGFIPLWDEDVTLRWRFNEVSMQAFAEPEAAKTAIEALFYEAVDSWDIGCPVKFERDEARYDFEIVMRSQARCNLNGCVLASAFFPDGGQHEVVLYPTMFEQPREEQLETLVHEIGHIFGLRHFFALISEQDWPAIIYGEHKKFSIMNYGADSKLTDADKADLRDLYDKVWSREIVTLNGTRVELMRPFSTQ